MADPLLDYLEQAFGAAYRQEIDQEENVWRSLPFFAATLALQITGLAQIESWMAAIQGWMLWATMGLLSAAGAATLAALVFLAFSVWPADFRRVAPETEFLAYAEDVRAETERSAPAAADPDDVALIALQAVKATLARQYALAVDSNRLVNVRRAKWRSRAGLATLASVFAVLVLVGLVVLSNVHGHAQQQPGESDRPGAAGVTETKVGQQGRAAGDGRLPPGLVFQPHDRAVGK